MGSVEITSIRMQASIALAIDLFCDESPEQEEEYLRACVGGIKQALYSLFHYEYSSHHLQCVAHPRRHPRTHTVSWDAPDLILERSDVPEGAVEFAALKDPIRWNPFCWRLLYVAPEFGTGRIGLFNTHDISWRGTPEMDLLDEDGICYIHKSKFESAIAYSTPEEVSRIYDLFVNFQGDWDTVRCAGCSRPQMTPIESRYFPAVDLKLAIQGADPWWYDWERQSPPSWVIPELHLLQDLEAAERAAVQPVQDSDYEYEDPHYPSDEEMDGQGDY